MRIEVEPGMPKQEKWLYATMLISMLVTAFVNIGVMAFGFDPAVVMPVTQASSIVFLVTIAIAFAKVMRETRD